MHDYFRSEGVAGAGRGGVGFRVGRATRGRCLGERGSHTVRGTHITRSSRCSGCRVLHRLPSIGSRPLSQLAAPSTAGSATPAAPSALHPPAAPHLHGLLPPLELFNMHGTPPPWCPPLPRRGCRTTCAAPSWAAAAPAAAGRRSGRRRPRRPRCRPNRCVANTARRPWLDAMYLSFPLSH